MKIYKDHCVHAIVLQVGEFRVGTSKHDIKQHAGGTLRTVD